MRLRYLIVGDRRVKLRDTQGKDGTAGVLAVLFGPIGLIKHSKKVDIKEGTPLLAYTDEITSSQRASRGASAKRQESPI